MSVLAFEFSFKTLESSVNLTAVCLLLTFSAFYTSFGTCAELVTSFDIGTFLSTIRS